jgi:hypothetical protein
MSIIVAGHFQLQNQVEEARRHLLDAGFDDRRICAFYLSQPGQHNLTPIGGDKIISPEARDTPSGILQGEAAGGAAGAVLGAATIPVTGPLGPILGGLLGAHVGSLYSFSKMKDKEEQAADGEHVPEPRHAGMMIAAAAEDEHGAQLAIDVLQRLGATQVERAEGTIAGGDWVDFNPNSAPHLVP